MKDSKSLKILIVALCIGVVGLAIGYSSLSTQLQVTSTKVTLNPQSWNVGFVTGTVSGIATATSTTGFSCGVATVNANTVSIANTNLSKPQDKCVYPLTIQNTGTIDAIISGIVVTNPTGTACSFDGASMVCGNITYKLATNQNGSTLLGTNQVLNNTNGTLNVYLIAEYTAETLVSETVEQEGAAFTVTYAQR